MKLITALFITLSACTALPALANADDVKWVNKCIADNKNEGAKPEVVKKYCECMNSKMDDNESKSISQWEKTHPDEMKQCEKAAGWK